MGTTPEPYGAEQIGAFRIWKQGHGLGLGMEEGAEELQREAIELEARRRGDQQERPLVAAAS